MTSPTALNEAAHASPRARCPHRAVCPKAPPAANRISPVPSGPCPWPSAGPCRGLRRGGRAAETGPGRCRGGKRRARPDLVPGRSARRRPSRPARPGSARTAAGTATVRHPRRTTGVGAGKQAAANRREGAARTLRSANSPRHPDRAAPPRPHRSAHRASPRTRPARTGRPRGVGPLPSRSDARPGWGRRPRRCRSGPRSPSPARARRT